MADDNNQRPYRPNDMRARAPAQPASGNDPLAELARLIGQSDPFAEFGRDSGRRAAPAAPQAAPEQRAPAANAYTANPARADAPQAQNSGAQNAPLAGHDTFSFASGTGVYRTGTEAPAYAGTPGQAEAFAGEPYYEDDQSAEDEDIYDDMPPPRRRVGVIAIAAVFGLAVIGTAGAFGYRSLFGSSGSHAPPPVIKADNAPIKVVPSAPGKDPQSSKLITDRVGDRQNEKIVSREETPVDVKGNTGLSGQNVQASAPLTPANGSGVVTAEPKKIHTITIRPEQVGMADTGASAPTPAPVQASPPPPRAEITPQPPAPRPAPPPQRVANVPPVVAATNPEPVPEPRPAVAQSAPPAPVHRTAASSNTPLSLNPDAAPARASAPSRPAAAAPARAALPTGSGGGYAVQVSAQRSEAEAQAAFRSMQAKYPNQLGNREPIIRRVDLGEKGIYFRAMIGPFASSGQASELCSSLKSAGGQCIIQKI